MQTQATTPQRPIHQRVPRLSGWLLITICLMAAIWFVAPQQLPVSLYKLSLVVMAAVVGYWLDRSLFPYARPDSFQELVYQLPTLFNRGEEVKYDSGEDLVAARDPQNLLFATAMLRRAIIVGCAMLAMGLGA